jgi:LPS-assembly protein
MIRPKFTGFTLIAILAACGQASGQAAPDACPAPGVPARPVLEEALQPGAVYLSADTVESIEGGITRLSGNAEIARDTRQARAGVADYDKAADSIELRGGVDYWDDRIYLHSEAARIDLTARTASVDDTSYRILANGAQGRAAELHVLSDRASEGRNIDYTTCTPADTAGDGAAATWKLSAEKITLDHEANWGTGRNVVLKIKDIPILYTPYISFPLSNERKTGFLAPSFGNTRRNGVEIQTPFYWNIAPDMDATLTPRLIADSGLMLMGEFRYLRENGHGTISAEFLPSDSNLHDRDRGFFSLEHEQSLPYNGRLHVLFNHLSDDRYLEDFGPSLDVTSLSVVDRYAEVSFNGDNWDVQARIQDFQTTNRQNPYALKPYKRLPQIRFTYSSPLINRSLDFSLESELAYFDRSNQVYACPSDACILAPQIPFAPGNFIPALVRVVDVEGLRFDLNPSFSYPIRNAGSYLVPKLGFRYTAYSLNDENSGYPGSADRLLPYASLDSGLVLERDLRILDEEHTQTLEPRLYYLYTPLENQNDLPVFDSGIYDDSFDSLFYENRFSGIDRINDANRVTLAITSRLLNGAGFEMGHFSIGQIYYLDAQDIRLPGQIIQDRDLSPLVFELGVNLDRQWSLQAGWQWEPHDNRLQKLDLQARYRSQTGRVLNFAYRVRQAMAGALRTDAIDIEQTDVSLRWPITSELNLVGRWIYAVEEHKSLDIFGGIEYDSCCWGLRVVGRRFVSNVEGDVQTGIFLQFELKGLAGLGQKTVDFLQQNIPGYQNEF